MAVAVAREVTGFIQEHGVKTEDLASVRATLIILVTPHALAAHQMLRMLERCV